MMKEAIEDYKRYRQDVEVNNRNVEVRVQQAGQHLRLERGGRIDCSRSSWIALPQSCKMRLHQEGH